MALVARTVRRTRVGVWPLHSPRVTVRAAVPGLPVSVSTPPYGVICWTAAEPDHHDVQAPGPLSKFSEQTVEPLGIVTGGVVVGGAVVGGAVVGGAVVTGVVVVGIVVVGIGVESDSV